MSLSGPQVRNLFLSFFLSFVLSFFLFVALYPHELCMALDNCTSAPYRLYRCKNRCDDKEKRKKGKVRGIITRNIVCPFPIVLRLLRNQAVVYILFFCGERDWCDGTHARSWQRWRTLGLRRRMKQNKKLYSHYVATFVRLYILTDTFRPLTSILSGSVRRRRRPPPTATNDVSVSVLFWTQLSSLANNAPCLVSLVALSSLNLNLLPRPEFLLLSRRRLLLFKSRQNVIWIG